jgi:hypothetical protein
MGCDAVDAHGPASQKFFARFFSKKRCFLPPTAPGVDRSFHSDYVPLGHRPGTLPAQCGSDSVAKMPKPPARPDLPRLALVWVILFAAYMLFAQVPSPGEFGAAGACACAGTAAMAALAKHTRRRFAIRPRWLWHLARTQLPAAITECWPLFLALFRPLAARERGLGEILAIPFDGKQGRNAREAAGRRALVTAALSFTPNSVVIGLELQPGHLLLHQLQPSPRPPGAGDPVWPV